jgi:hypothetical protein
MPSRKQRKRVQKGRRHEHVWYDIDEFGNEVEMSPDEVAAMRASTASDSNGKPQQKRPPQQSSRATRTPLPPSWRRATKRAILLGVVIFVLFSLLSSKDGKNGYASALLLALGYTALFIPFTYYVDRFSYRRWERKAAEQPRKR